MNKRIKLVTLLAASVLLAGAGSLSGSQQSAQAKTYHKAVTKIAGNGNYAIYRRVSGHGPAGKFSSTRYFKHGQIQSKRYLKTRKGTFWDIYVDGRHVGWVNQNFFARNKIAVASGVDIIKGYSFPTKDAISYATDSRGTAVSLSKVKASKNHVSAAGSVNFTYGKAHASIQVNDHEPQLGEPDSSLAKKGFKTTKSWNHGSKGSSRNWNARHGYRSETRGNTFRTKGLTLKTRLFQPRFVSLGYGRAADAMGQVGVTPEGITVRNNVFAASMFSHTHSMYGHLVSYNLKHIKSKTAAQNLTTMRWKTFKSYAQNIKVSPYMKLGHGQSVGSSNDYIYVMANNNKVGNSTNAEEIFQVKKSNMQISHVWTFKVAERRYIHNADFTDDGTMYALFHNGGYHRYEFWKLSLQDGTWVPEEVGATNGDFVKGSPVQGFTYGGGNFYVAFNDNIFKVGENGTAKRHYHFKINREIEGLAYSGSRLYTEFAQRSELTSGVPR